MKELTSGNVVKLEEGERLDGEYLNCEESSMFKDSYAVKVKDGEEVKTLFVSKIVKDLLETHNIKPGQKIGILFVGMKDNKTGTAKYKDYKVFAE